MPEERRQQQRIAACENIPQPNKGSGKLPAPYGLKEKDAAANAVTRGKSGPELPLTPGCAVLALWWIWNSN